jgi:hypothetical protein
LISTILNKNKSRDLRIRVRVRAGSGSGSGSGAEAGAGAGAGNLQCKGETVLPAFASPLPKAEQLSAFLEFYASYHICVEYDVIADAAAVDIRHFIQWGRVQEEKCPSVFFFSSSVSFLAVRMYPSLKPFV